MKKFVVQIVVEEMLPLNKVGLPLFHAFVFGSRGHPRMKLAFLISLSSLLLPGAEMLLLQQTNPCKMDDATTES